jgi:3-oxo-5-alpha-steroid 4-dehydrogenase 1
MMTWYTGNSTYDTVLAIGFGYALFVVIGGFFGSASYGVFASKKLRFNFDPRWGWFLMELPATLSFFYFYSQGQNRAEAVPLFFLFVWTVHYANRGYIFPLLMRVVKGAKGDFHISVVVLGILVTTMHGYLNAKFIADLGDQYTLSWFTDPRFVIGAVLYYTGFTMNIYSDWIVRNLRSKEEAAAGENVFRIPYGGLFRWISAPSYFTEILSWVGFALMTWSLGAVFVLVVTAGNLIPRSFAIHKWYKEQFPDYPKDRKALLPFIG